MLNNSITITPLTVTQLNNQVKTSLENKYQNLNVIGEINELNKHSSGHVYFKLKDEMSSVPCVMFNSAYKKNNINFEEGDKVLVIGNATLYLIRGTYQLTIQSIKLFDQKGNVYKKYEQLKKKLQTEGLFQDDYKKKIPNYPLNIGLVTSLNGSVIQDIINVCKRRSQNIDLIVAPSSVQGEGASNQIMNAIDKLIDYNVNNKIDIIIIARGGGSFEDLNCFNDEFLARKIFSLNIPVVSAVGHETDFTIIDFVSDMRVSTPSVAAELCVPDDKDTFQSIDSLIDNMLSQVNINLAEYKKKYNNSERQVASFNPKLIIENYKIRMMNIRKKIIDTYSITNKNLHNKVIYYDKLLYSNNPYNILDKGFVAVLDKNNKLVKRIKDINLDDKINVKFSDGLVLAQVNSKVYNNDKK